MMDSGDLHNFGKQVSLDHDEKLFFKPRCIFWEHFYFGTDSPLLKSIKKLVSTEDFQFFQNHFLLHINSKQPGVEGHSLKVESQPINDQIHFKDTGKLIAYCSIFGLLDLHTGNLVYNGTRFIPIDIEVVNASIRVPSETLLFPLNEEERPYSLYFLLLPYLNEENCKLLLEGMIEMLECFAQHSNALLASLDSKDLSSYPVRVIVRHTLDYRIKDNTDLLAEEEIQLKRGDIPYFFKYLGGQDLFFYEEEMKPRKCVELNERALKKFNLIGHPFSDLLQSERIQSVLRPNFIFMQIIIFHP